MQPRRPAKTPWNRPLADLVGQALDPVLAKQGFGQSDILLYWDEIVGERLASMTEPLRLRWPPRGPAKDRGFEPATLVVRVESGFALELQHLSALVIERINAHLGFACVGRLSLKQGPVTRKRADRARREPPSEAALAGARARVGDVTDEPLREALVRLGARILERSR
ncbi:MAG TPA: DciA family protein [Methylovirgula sp.]